MFEIVLVEPEIPQNTGNIIRTAAATGGRVHLIEPLGFDISDKALKRAGLDYWHMTDFEVYSDPNHFFSRVGASADIEAGDYSVTDAGGRRFWFCSTKGTKRYTDANFKSGDYLVFGKETRGLPEELLRDNYDSTIRIPMVLRARSLNLSNSVAIVVYEALRQTGFNGLCEEGKLTRYPRP